MYKIDSTIQNILKQEIELPESYKKTIKNTIQKCTQQSKNSETEIKKYKILNTIKKIGITAIIGASTITVYAVTTNNLPFQEMGLMKLSQNYDANAVEINKTIENEYTKVTLETMSGDGSYIILEYRINLKDKAINEYGNINYNDAMGYSLWLAETSLVNSKEITNKLQEITKISETEFICTQVLNIMDIKDENLNLIVNMDELVLNSKISKPINLGKKLQINMNLKNNDQNNFTPQEKVIDENNKIIIDNVGNTKFETYISAQKIIENITYKEFKKLNPLKYNSFIVTNENGDEIPYLIRNEDWAGKYLYVKNANGELTSIDSMEAMNTLKDEDIIKYVENYIILIGNQENLNTIKIVPIETTMFNDRNNEEKQEYDKLTWYPLIEGEQKYSAQSSLGGTLEIEKIKINENNIEFYYNEKGLMGNDSLIILRRNNGEMNYIYPIKTERKGINGTENKITFSKDLFGVAGLNIISLGDLHENIDNVEFALLFGSRSKKIADDFTIEIPNQNNSIVKIENVEINDI